MNHQPSRVCLFTKTLKFLIDHFVFAAITKPNTVRPSIDNKARSSLLLVKDSIVNFDFLTLTFNHIMILYTKLHSVTKHKTENANGFSINKKKCYPTTEVKSTKIYCLDQLCCIFKSNFNTSRLNMSVTTISPPFIYTIYNRPLLR